MFFAPISGTPQPSGGAHERSPRLHRWPHRLSDRPVSPASSLAAPQGALDCCEGRMIATGAAYTNTSPRRSSPLGVGGDFRIQRRALPRRFQQLSGLRCLDQASRAHSRLRVPCWNWVRGELRYQRGFLSVSELTGGGSLPSVFRGALVS
jgi:hypothetical protein